MELMVSFLVSLIAVPVFMKVAEKLDIVDRPDGVLKPHKRATPYLGGLGLFVGLIPALWRRTDLVVLASISTSLGLLDDLIDLDPKLRLFVEVAISAYIVFIFIGFENVLYSLILMIAFTALVNAVNMIDGLDGICAGSVAISATFFALAAPNPLTVSLSLSVVGASLGYLVYNFPPAKVFMGDAGSYLLGVMLSVLYASSVRGPDPTFRTLKYTFPLWIYALDLIIGFFRRMKNGRSPFKGDRDHFYDKIYRKLKNPKTTALTVYALVGSFSFLTLTCSEITGCVLSTSVALVLSFVIVKSLNLAGYD